MVIIQTALYIEAKKAIEYFGLREVKKTPLPLRLFADDANAFAVIVTGTGAVSACAGVAAALTHLKAGRGDIFVNFGIAGASEGCDLSIGDVVRCVKCSASDERPFYPDIMFGKRFKLAEIETVRRPAKILADSGNTVPLAADMELYYAFQAANMFLGPESLISYKLISDFAPETAEQGGRIDKTLVENIINETWEKLFPEIENISKEAKREFCRDTGKLPEGCEELFEALCEKLSLSFSNRVILRNKLWRDSLIGVSVKERLEAVLDTPADIIPKDKKGIEAFVKDNLLCEFGGETP